MVKTEAARVALEARLGKEQRMQSWSRRIPLLGFLALTALAANGCGSDAKDGDDDDDGGDSGSVLGGSSGAGGSSATGGSGGSTGGSGGSTAGSGGASNAGSGNAPASGGVGTGGATGGTTAAGSGGSSTSGSGGSGGSTLSADIGAACDTDAECGADGVCITVDSSTFGSGGPPHGMCTKACEDSTDCGTTGLCVSFDEANTVLYCIEGCEFGTNAEPKCHERADFACTILTLVDTTVECESSDECSASQLCNSETGFCGDMVPACLPNCGGDYDCPSGQFCDYQSGLCTEESPTGQEIGSACDPTATADPCSGFCIATDETNEVGVCTATCTLSSTLVGCGWDGTAAASAACLFPVIAPPDGSDPGFGDVSLCVGLCDCNDDCPASTDFCVDETGGYVAQIWGRQGYCRPLADDETEDDTFACE